MRGVPLLMYSRIRSSSPPSVSRDKAGPYCRVRCCTSVWQTPQDWLKRRNPSRWVSLSDASGTPCAKSTDADATTNAATKTPCRILPSSGSGASHALAYVNLTPCSGGVERGGVADTANHATPACGASHPGVAKLCRISPKQAAGISVKSMGMQLWGITDCGRPSFDKLRRAASSGEVEG